MKNIFKLAALFANVLCAYEAYSAGNAMMPRPINVFGRSIVCVNGVPATVQGLLGGEQNNRIPYNYLCFPSSATKMNRVINNRESRKDECLTQVAFEYNSKITSIVDNAFSYCIALRSICIPSSIKVINNFAFYNCSTLSSLTFSMPSNTIEIGRYAFSGCKSLQCVYIPSTVEVIEEGAFRWCDSLSIVVFEEESELREIKNDAFRSSGLTRIIIPAKVATIGKYAFSFCEQLSQIDFEYFEANNECFLKKIDSYAFNSCAIQEINIPNSVEIVGDSAFYNCNNLRTVYFASDKLVSLGSKVFFECNNLSDVSILCPIESFSLGVLFGLKGIIHLSSEIFETNCDLGDVGSQEKIRCGLSKLFSYYKELGSEDCYNTIVDFANDGKGIAAHIYYSNGIIEEWVSNSETWNVKSGEEPLCPVMPVPLKFIDDSNFVIGHDFVIARGFVNIRAFVVGETPSMDINEFAVEAVVPETVFITLGALADISAFAVDNISADDDLRIKTVNYTGYVGRQVLDKFVGLRVCNRKEIGTYFVKSAYGQTSHRILFVELGRETEQILCGAFYGCGFLSKIIIPSGVKVIGKNAFLDCKYLAQVLFEEDSALESIGEKAFCHCESLLEISIPQLVNFISWMAFWECVNLISVNFLESNIKEIKGSTFGWCESLNNIRIPSSITAIGEDAFVGCHALEEIEIPPSVTAIEFNAFSGCIALRSFVMHEGVKKISREVFNECESLESIDIPASVEEFGPNFWKSGLTEINFKSKNVCGALEPKDFLDRNVKDVIENCIATFEDINRTFVFNGQDWQELV